MTVAGAPATVLVIFVIEILVAPISNEVVALTSGILVRTSHSCPSLKLFPYSGKFSITDVRFSFNSSTGTEESVCNH